MSRKTLLQIVRGVCIFQFIVVLLYVFNGGISKSEMGIVVFSAVFGLLLDGFFHTVITAGLVNAKKKKLDKEFNVLLDNVQQQLKEKE